MGLPWVSSWLLFSSLMVSGQRIFYQLLVVFDMMEFAVFGNHPYKNYEILFTPVFFKFFCLTHSESSYVYFSILTDSLDSTQLYPRTCLQCDFFLNCPALYIQISSETGVYLRTPRLYAKLTKRFQAATSQPRSICLKLLKEVNEGTGADSISQGSMGRSIWKGMEPDYSSMEYLINYRFDRQCPHHIIQQVEVVIQSTKNKVLIQKMVNSFIEDADQSSFLFDIQSVVIIIMLNEQDPLQTQQLPKMNRKTYKSKCTITLLTWTFVISSFCHGYTLTYFSSIDIKTLLSIYNVTFDQNVAQGLINAITPFGSLFGALTSFLILQRFTRRHSILVIDAVAFLAGLLVYIPNIYSLVLCRLVQGYCAGAFSSIVPMIVKQLVPVQLGGIMVSLVQLNIATGTLCPYLFCYILKKMTGDYNGQSFWFLIFGLTLLTIMAQVILLLFLFPYQTPKYWLLMKNQANCRKLIQLIYLPQYVQLIVQQKKKDIQHLGYFALKNQNQSLLLDSVQAQYDLPDSKQHQQTSYKTAMFIAIHVSLTQQFSGVNAVNLYCVHIVQDITTGQLVLLMPTIIILVKVIFGSFNSAMSRCLGRKIMFQVGVLMIAIATTTIGIGFLIKDPQVTQVMVICGLFVFMAAFGASVGPITWLYISQVVPSRGVSIATAGNWLVVFAVILLFPIIKAHVLGGNPGAMFFFFAAWCLSSFLINFKFMVQTKDKTQRDIREEFQKISLC